MQRKMKEKTFFTGFVACLTLWIILGVFLAIAQTEGDPIAIVITINGSMEFRESSEGEWKNAKVGEKLFEGYELRTGSVDKAMIVYPTSNARVLINSNTEMAIASEEIEGRTRGRANIFVGEIRSRVARGRSFDVETPSSVASVRGTDFNVDVDDAGSSTLLVLEGLVSFRNQFGEVLAEQYTRTTATGQTAPTEPESVDPEEAEDAVQWSEEVETTYDINLVPDGGTTMAVGDVFGLDVRIIDKEQGTLDTDANFDLTSISGGGSVLLSLDGSDWSDSPPVSIVDGKASLQARIDSEGEFTVTASAPNCSPGSVTITAQTPKEMRRVDLQFKQSDGEDTKTMTIEMEQK